MSRLRIYECPMFPLHLVFIDSIEDWEKLVRKTGLADRSFPPIGGATTHCVTGGGIGVLLIVALGDTSESTDNEIRSILTHEAVHAKQYLFESIGEETIGVETEAYVVQFLANYLIAEQQRNAKARAKEIELSTKSTN